MPWRASGRGRVQKKWHVHGADFNPINFVIPQNSAKWSGIVRIREINQLKTVVRVPEPRTLPKQKSAPFVLESANAFPFSAFIENPRKSLARSYRRCDNHLHAFGYQSSVVDGWSIEVP
jgi:hypothetical protein